MQNFEISCFNLRYDSWATVEGIFFSICKLLIFLMIIWQSTPYSVSGKCWMQGFLWLDFPDGTVLHLSHLNCSGGEKEVGWTPQLIVPVHGFPRKTDALPAYPLCSTLHAEKNRIWESSQTGKSNQTVVWEFQRTVVEIFKSPMTRYTTFGEPVQRRLNPRSLLCRDNEAADKFSVRNCTLHVQNPKV